MTVFEFKISLRTGERIGVAHVVLQTLNASLVSALRSPGVAPLVSLCTRMPVHVVEDAKIGHTRPFEALLGTSPEGCFTKFCARHPGRGLCSEMAWCPSADEKTCVARFGKIPMCWSFKSDGQLSADESDVARSVINAWREQQYVIISE